MRDFNQNHAGSADVPHAPGNGRNGASPGAKLPVNGIVHTNGNGKHHGNGLAGTNGKASTNGKHHGEVSPLFPSPALSIVGKTNRSPVPSPAISPRDVHATLSKHILVDGFDMVIDLKQSQGSRIYCAKHEKWYLDFFSFFVSLPIGMNHPRMTSPEFMEKLAYVAVNKPSNSDVYTVEMAEFLETFSRVAIPEYLPYAFFIEGGALAVENTLKAAFDWKVRKNFMKGCKTERGHQIIHFKQAFHGRSGYTLSLTNTDPSKTQYFPMFKWPRVSNPAMRFPLTDANLMAVEEAERLSLLEIKQALRDNPDDVAAIIIEPIQGEGGDNHFRREFMVKLREIADENELLLIMDEVQTGIGLTGKMWGHQHFVQPDLISFGKKSQVCGMLCGRRIDEVEENVFKASSRVNSTWGGGLVDMVRVQRYLEIIEAENLVENARVLGDFLLASLRALEAEFPTLISNARGRGLFCAVDLPEKFLRDELRERCFNNGLLILPSGLKSIRFRPPLDIRRHEIDEAIHIIRKSLGQMAPRLTY